MSPALPNDHMQVLMYKLAMAGLELPVGPAYDPDAEAYFNRAGVTDATAKSKVSKFIQGLKSLDKWTPLVTGCDFKDADNAGTGSAAYALKGTFDGTLINGPTWGSSGISNGAATSYIDFGSFGLTQPVTCIFVCSPSPGNPTGATYAGAGSTSAFAYNSSTDEFSAYSGLVASSSQAFGSGFSFFASVINGASSSLVKNGSVASPLNVGAENATGLTLGASYGTDGANHAEAIYSLSLVFNEALSSSDIQSIRTLYKSTIGVGMGLP